MTLRIIPLALWLAASAALAQTQPVNLRFHAVIGDRDFVCGNSYAAIGTTKSTITPTDLRLYVSNVRLVRADGTAVPVELEQDGIWQHKNLALLDFEDGSGPCRNGTKGVRRELTGRAPTGDYRGVRFTFGVPFELNHGDPTIAPSPLNVTALFWNWQGGYRFLKFDFNSQGLARAARAAGHGGHGGDHGAASGFAVHLGSTRCQSGGPTQPAKACENPNRVEVEFERFDPAKNEVVIDVGAIIGGTDIDVNTPNTSPGCMSFPGDPDCKEIMRRLGLPYDGAAAGKQMLFRMR